MYTINKTTLLLAFALFLAMPSMVSANVILDENFRSGINTSIWYIYNASDIGAPGDEPADSYFLPVNAIANSSGLHLLIKRETPPDGIGNYTGAGLETIGSQYYITNGRVEARIKFPSSNQGLIGYALLWPSNQAWPPEIDFSEIDGVTANMNMFTQYWGTSNRPNTLEYDLTPINVTQYHEYAVEVDNKNLCIRWYVDGNLITTQTYHSSNRSWIFGAGTWTCLATTPPQYCGSPANATLPASMDIDYVRIYNYTTTPDTTSPSSFINGTVKDNSTGNNLAGVTVSANSTLSTTTNSTGFYSFAVTDGTYNIISRYDIRYYTNTTTVSTIGKAVVVQDIELVKKPTGNITGSVAGVAE